MLPHVTLIEIVTGRNLACDIDCHRITFPVVDQRLLAKISVHELLDEFVAAKLEKLHVRFHATIDRHGDPPWPRVDLGVFDRHFVPDDVGRHQLEALDQVQRIAVKIAGAVEPAAIVEIGHVDDQSVAVPPSDRVAHPRIVGRAFDLVCRDTSPGPRCAEVKRGS